MNLQEINSGYILFGNRPHAVYSLLQYLEPGLMLDVGAAAGVYSKIMISKSPDSHVHAFEPFPGNFEHFEKNISKESKVTLNKLAVSDQSGEVNFFVSSTVSGKEPRWENYIGYSSLGYIVSQSSPKVNSSIKVPSVRLDDFVTDHVRFCKIDVQGGEESVLRGAGELIQNHGVDIFYIEFSGEEPILQFLENRGYVFFDNLYLLVAVRNKPDFTHWKEERQVLISTGRDAFNAWPRNAPRSYGDYCSWMREQTKEVGGVWTDMVCVHKSFLPNFFNAVADALRAERNTS